MRRLFQIRSKQEDSTFSIYMSCVQSVFLETRPLRIAPKETLIELVLFSTRYILSQRLCTNCGFAWTIRKGGH